MELKVILYSSFQVGPISSNYRLSISGFKVITEIDPFSQNRNRLLNGMPFTTKDRDNDKWNSNCAKDHIGTGGWWYNACSGIYLNHKYKSNYGIYLNGWKALSFTEIKIRPINCII